ncbi:MAG: thermonuclease family protein [Alphaproteobacteria bacterium]
MRPVELEHAGFVGLDRGIELFSEGPVGQRGLRNDETFPRKPARDDRNGTLEGIALYYRRFDRRQPGSRPIRTHRNIPAVLASLAFLVLVAAAAAAGGLPDQTPEPVAEGRVARVIDGDTLVLEDGAHVRLTGIQAPKIPMGRPGFKPWPLGEEAKGALAALAEGRAVRLRYGGRRIDRWRRLLAHVEADGVWLQGEMLRRGLARVYSFPDNVSRAPELYAVEREARAKRAGIWALDWYWIRTPDETASAIGTFQIVEGVPRDIATVRGTTYLNFGNDLLTDFTLSVSARDAHRFRGAGPDQQSLRGRPIRVRGWLNSRNGAMLRLTHSEQLEVADQP